MSQHAEVSMEERIRMLRRKKELMEAQFGSQSSSSIPAADAPPPPEPASPSSSSSEDVTGLPRFADSTDGSDRRDMYLRFLEERKRKLQLQCLQARQLLEASEARRGHFSDSDNSADDDDDDVEAGLDHLLNEYGVMLSDTGGSERSSNNNSNSNNNNSKTRTNGGIVHAFSSNLSDLLGSGGSSDESDERDERGAPRRSRNGNSNNNNNSRPANGNSNSNSNNCSDGSDSDEGSLFRDLYRRAGLAAGLTSTTHDSFMSSSDDDDDEAGEVPSRMRGRAADARGRSANNNSSSNNRSSTREARHETESETESDDLLGGTGSLLDAMSDADTEVQGDDGDMSPDSRRLRELQDELINLRDQQRQAQMHLAEMRERQRRLAAGLYADGTDDDESGPETRASTGDVGHEALSDESTRGDAEEEHRPDQGSEDGESIADIDQLHQRLDLLLEQQRRLADGIHAMAGDDDDIFGVDDDDSEEEGDEDRPGSSSGRYASFRNQGSPPNSDREEEDHASDGEAPCRPPPATAATTSSSSATPGVPRDAAARSSTVPPMQPAAPESQVMIRSRNSQPLGCLLLGQTNGGVRPTAPQSKIETLPITYANISHKDIVASGIDGRSIREYLSGSISGPMCIVRLLDSMQGSKESLDKAQQDLAVTTELFASKGDGHGGLLGVLVGGLSQAPISDIQYIFGGVLAKEPSARSALESAAERIRDSAGYSGALSCADPLGGISEQQVNMAFRRQCLGSHPHRSSGSLTNFLRSHLDQELVRQWLHSVEHGVGLSGSGHEFTDKELVDEIKKEDAQVLTDEADPDDSKGLLWEDHHTEQMSRLKDQKTFLQAQLGLLKSSGAYILLGLTSDASDADIAKAYKAKALEMHPDRGGSKAKFQELRAAYESILAARGNGAKGEKSGKERGERRRKKAGEGGGGGGAKKKTTTTATTTTTTTTPTATATAPTAPGAKAAATAATATTSQPEVEPEEGKTDATLDKEEQQAKIGGSQEKKEEKNAKEAKDKEEEEEEEEKEKEDKKEDKQKEDKEEDEEGRTASPREEEKQTKPATKVEETNVSEDKQDGQQAEKEEAAMPFEASKKSVTETDVAGEDLGGAGPNKEANDNDKVGSPSAPSGLTEDDDEKEKREDGSSSSRSRSSSKEKGDDDKSDNNNKSDNSNNNSNNNKNNKNEEEEEASSSQAPPDRSTAREDSKKGLITEEMCRVIIESIPSESISDCTEKVFDAARLCQQTARHIEVLFNDGSQPWSLVKTLSTRCIFMADKVSDLAGLVGKQAAHVPDKLLPMLSFMSDIASDLDPSTAHDVLQRAQRLISMTTDLAGMGKDILTKITELATKILEFRRALFWMGSNTELTYSNTGASMLWSGELGKLSVACADSLSAAALRVADARQSAMSFIQALQSAGAWTSDGDDDDEDEEDEDEETKKDGDEDEDSNEAGEKRDEDDSDGEQQRENKEPENITVRLRRHRMFKQLNQEVLNMQAELRELVCQQPSHLDPVSERQKASLFGLVMEVVGNVNRNVLRSWREFRFCSDVEDESLHAKILEDFAVVVAAGSWHKIAVPSIDARLLRMAALVDADLLRSLLFEDLVDKALLLVGGRSKAPQLAASLDKILDDLSGFSRRPN